MDVTMLATDRAVHEIRLIAGEQLTASIERPLNSSYSSVELLCHDGLASVYFAWNEPASVRGRRMDVFPAVVGTIQIPLPGYGSSSEPFVNLRLISEGAPLVSLIRR